MSERARRPSISIVVPCLNEAEGFADLRHALVGLADRIATSFDAEFILVDDGSRDSTWQQIRDFAEEDARVRGVSFSRNFGHQSALTCGYDLASGDAVVSLDADLQDPPEVILEMIDRWQKGADVVLGVREERDGETLFKRWTATLFYRAIRWLGADHVREESGDFRLLSRRSLLGLRRMREQHRFLRGMVGWVGYRTAEVRYQRRPRARGRTKYGFRKMLLLAIDAMVSFSIAPLRLAYVLSFGIAVSSLGFLGYTVIRTLGSETELVPGWTSLILSITAFGAMTLLCLGLLGEYVGRIYEQSKDRPLYLVQDETASRTPDAGGD